MLFRDLILYGSPSETGRRRSLMIPDRPALPARREAPTVPLEGGSRGLGIVNDREIFDNTERSQRGKVITKRNQQLV